MNYQRIDKKETIDGFEPDLCELLYRVYHTNFSGHTIGTDFLKGEVQRIRSYVEDGSATIYACFHENHIVGLIWAYKRTFLSEKEMHIPILVVKDGFERRGIAGKLMEAIKKEALQAGISKLTLVVSSDNESALSFYKKNGFLETRKTLECEVAGHDH